MKKIVMMFGVMLSATFAFADTWTDPETGITWTYTVSDGKASVGGGSSSSPAVPTSTAGAITIPSSLGGYPVTIVGSYAFYQCADLTSVTIQSGVTTIKGSAFKGCDSLASVTIPEGVTGISTAFNSCKGLKSITIPSSVTSIVGVAFYNCSSLTNVTIRSGVTSIGSSAFENCSALTSVTILEGPVELESATFSGCVSLEKVSIPLSVERISYSGGAVHWKDVFYGCRNVKDVAVSHRFPLDNVFEESYQGITNVVLHTGVETTGDWLCSGCTSLTGVTIPEGVTRIGNGAFYNCTALPSVKIPESVTSIGDSAFYRCVGLKELTVPFYVMSVEKGAFMNCSSITNISFKGDMPDFGENVFDGTSKRMTISITKDAVGWDYYEKHGLEPPWGDRQVIIGGGGGGGGGGGSTNVNVTLTVTNIVIHYIQTSELSPMAAPITPDVGIVNVMTEIEGGIVAVPESWATNYPSFKQKFGDDFAKALTTETGKFDANRKPMYVWQDYVAGTDPTDVTDQFRASVTMVGGKPVISFTPVLSEKEAAKRTYTTYGKLRLQDEQWTPIPKGQEDDYNFFKVTVKMK